MTVRTTNLGGIDWSDGEVLYAADLNDTFGEEYDKRVAVDLTLSTKLGFNVESIYITGASSSQYSAGDVIAKFKLYGGSGNNIENIYVSLGFYCAYSTRPTYLIEYSTDNTNWSTLKQEPSAISGTTLGAVGNISGTVNGLSNNTYYIRLVGNSQASFTLIHHLDINFHTANGGSKTLSAFGRTLNMIGGSQQTGLLSTSNGSAADNYILPTVISAPNGETISSVSVIGYLAGGISSNSSSASGVIEYSTDGSSYSSMDESNSETKSGNSGDKYTFHLYGLKESLSSNDVYLSIKMTKGAVSYTIPVYAAHLFIIATY